MIEYFCSVSKNERETEHIDFSLPSLIAGSNIPPTEKLQASTQSLQGLSGLKNDTCTDIRLVVKVNTHIVWKIKKATYGKG